MSDYFLRPVEPLFFGNPSPFNAGELRYSKSVFPPSPLTFQGLIRSHLLRSVTPELDLDNWSEEARKERLELVGNSNSLPPGWQMKGPFPAEIKDGETLPYLPCPRFLFGNKNRAEYGILFKAQQPGFNDLDYQDIGDDFNKFIYCPDPEKEGKPCGGWVNSDLLYKIFSGEEQSISISDIPPFINTNQRKSGIALDGKTGTAKDGMLYHLDFLRFAENSGFWGSFEGRLDGRMVKNPLESGVTGVGRNSSLAYFEKSMNLKSGFKSLLKGEHLDGIKDCDYFFIYLLTPALVLENNSGHDFLPGNVEIRLSDAGLDNMLLKKDRKSKTSIKIISAITGDAEVIGGIDMVKGSVKPNNSYLPAGSSWLVQINAKTDEKLEILEKINNSHILGDKNQSGFGLGHILVGAGPELKEF